MSLIIAVFLFLNGVFYNDSMSFLAAGLFYIAYVIDSKFNRLEVEIKNKEE